MIGNEDKRNHPVFYWIFLFLVVVFVFQIFVLIADQVEGAWTANTYNSTTDTSAAYGNDEFVHTKDDKYAVAYVSSADELWVAHKPTTGGSWEYNLITDTFIYYTVAGMRCSSNNTLVVWANQYESTIYKGYIWVKWPGDGWDDWTGYYVDGGTGFFGMSLAINNTDDIALAWRKTNWVYCGIFNLTSLTITSSDSFGSGTNMDIDVESNQSGDFWILYGPGSGARYLRDYNKTYAAISKSGLWYYANMVCLPNDRFVVTTYYVSGSTFRYIYYWYQNTHNGPFISFYISTAPGTTSWTCPKIGIAQESLTPWVVSYNSTGNTVMSWHASWNAVQATWQASEEYIITETTYPLGTSSSAWPKAFGISWCQPKTGQAFHMMEDKATNLMQIWTQDISWTPDLTTAPPLITTSSLPDGTVDEEYSYTLSKSGGTAPFTWSIITAPAWLNIGSSNGTLWGTPSSTGSWSVRVRLTDIIPRYDEEVWTLTIVSAVSPVEPPEDPGRKWDFPSLIDSLIGGMWWVFMVWAMFIAIIDVVVTTRNRLSKR